MIGIFDSGSGGLTVLKALRDILPSCDVVYFGDIKNAPYGERSQEELSRLTIEAIQLLLGRGATKIVSACNSTSASLAVSIFDSSGVEPANMIEMVGPTVAYCKNIDGPILVCATPATIRSGIYQNAFRMAGKDVDVLPLPGLAGAIEFGAPQNEIEDIVRAGLATTAPPKNVVLACTHYPLVLPVFAAALPGAAIIDPALAVAERAYQRFWPQEVLGGKTTFVISKESPQFRALVAKLFAEAPYDIEVV